MRLAMLFSVIIPVHNAEQYIDRCLQSIFANDFENYEILTVENGSTDNSLAILNSYASEHPQIKVFSTSKKGVSNARNIGLDNATGDIVTFIDVDDTVERDYFTKIAASFSNDSTIDALIIGHSTIDQEGMKKECILAKEKKKMSGAEAIELILSGRNGIGGQPWDKVFKKSAIRKLRFNPEFRIGEDLVFSVQALSATHSVGICATSLYLYWLNESSASTKVFIRGSLHMLLDSASENYLAAHYSLIPYLLSCGELFKQSAELAFITYSDQLVIMLLSAFADKNLNFTEDHREEFFSVKKQFNAALRRKYKKKYIRLQYTWMCYGFKPLRLTANLFLGLNYYKRTTSEMIETSFKRIRHSTP